MPDRDPAQIDDLLARAAAFWSTRQQRLTVVRRIVALQVFARLAPFDAESLLAAARTEDRCISATSVYRTLGDLLTAGLLRSVPGGRGQRHYTVVDQPAAGLSHIVCADCDHVFPMPAPCLVLRESGLARDHGFTPRAMSLRVEATCDHLHATGACPRRPAPGLHA